MLAEQEMEKWLTDETYDYAPPQRGEIREGVILSLEEWGAMIDIGLKRDGFVPRTDLERLGDEILSELKPGQEVTTRVVQPRDQDDNLILSLYEARLEQDWNEAEKLLDSGDLSTGKVTKYNKGGLLVKFGELEGFIPASHLTEMNGQHLSGPQRQAKLQAYVGQEVPVQVIEVNRHRGRLILSERLARQQLRQEHTDRLLNELVEGEVVRGTVSRLTDFGAFVDLGGADGLVHISELAWQRVRHPSQVLNEGDEIDVYILQLDHDRKRISLSMKRLLPDPWTLVQETYVVDQLVPGKVTNVVDFGAFVALEIGVQGLIHISELSEPPPQKSKDVIRAGDEVLVRILRIDPSRRRLALSLKRVSEHERGEWLAQQSQEESEEPDETTDEG